MLRRQAPRPAGQTEARFAPFDPLALVSITIACQPPPRVRPLVVLALTIALSGHLLVLILLQGAATHEAPPQAQVAAITVEWIEAPPPPMVRPPQPERSAPLVSANRRVSTAQRIPTMIVDVVDPPAQRQPRLFAADGAVVGTEDAVRKLDARIGASARFDYQIAGIERAEGAFELPTALAFEGTRFDQYWRPSVNLLDDVLERAVKASALAVSVPVPGMPGYRVGCAIVVLAASGSCGLSEPSKLVYDIDDPTTLSAAEAAACETLWARITEAKTQDAQRRYRRIYELGCRLPLANGAPVRSDPQGFPTTAELKKAFRQW